MPIATNSIDVAGVRKAYTYSPETGKIESRHWGKLVGRKSPMGYVILTVSAGKHRRSVFAHRIAYVLMTGQDIPHGMFIDHINRDRSDNRWDNLRVCTHQQNLLNSHRDRANGLPPGVYENPGSSVRPFKAKIKVGGASKYLGSFPTVEQAKAAFDAARVEAYGEPKA